MKVRMVKGLAVVLCAAMLAPAAGAAGAVMMPGMVVEATGAEKPDDEKKTEVEKKDQKAFVAELQALLVGKNLNEKKQAKVDEVLNRIYGIIKCTNPSNPIDDASYDDCEYSMQVLTAYVDEAKMI